MRAADTASLEDVCGGAAARLWARERGRSCGPDQALERGRGGSVIERRSEMRPSGAAAVGSAMAPARRQDIEMGGRGKAMKA